MKLPEKLAQEFLDKVRTTLGDQQLDAKQAWRQCPRGDWMAYVLLVGADEEDLQPIIAALTKVLETLLLPVIDGTDAEPLVRRGLDNTRRWVAGDEVLEEIRRMGWDASDCCNQAVLDDRPAIGAAADVVNKLSALLELFAEASERTEQIAYLMETIEAATISAAYHRGAEEGPKGPECSQELQAVASIFRELPMPALSGIRIAGC